MKRSIVLTAACIFALMPGARVLAGPAGAPASSLQAALDARVAAVPGTAIAVGVIRNGTTSTYFAGSTGNGRPLDAHTLFEIGSVTKTFTATVLASMVLAGQVKLDAPVAAFLPPSVHVPSRGGKQITLLNLAEQRSGLPRLPTDMDDATGNDPYADYTRADMYAFLNGYKLTRDPGAKYLYSNYGIGLLGQALANAAHMPYPQLVRERVLTPLHMTGTTFATMPASDPPVMAVGHDLSGQPAPAWHFRSILPAGGIRSNLSDMLAYLRCNMGQGPLAAACLFAQKPRANGMAGHRIGLVWENNTATGVVSHGGDTLGFHAFIAVSKDRRTGVVVLSNGPLVTDIAAHVLVPSYPIAQCPAKVPARDADPSSYAGIYCNGMLGMLFTVAPPKGDGSLSIDLLPRAPLLYTRTAPDTYTNASVGATFHFIRQAGRIVGLRLLQAGETIPALRFGANGRPVVAQLPAPAAPTAVTLAPAILQQYVGTYTASLGAFTVTLRGDQLYVRLTGQPEIPVYASAKDHFFYKVVDAQIDFTRDAAGNVTSLTLHQNGAAVNATRSGPM
jgi:D-alanyl-D-alanine-carboxypeptidase/D-alanyl-D-alanine-endopeptidase